MARPPLLLLVFAALILVAGCGGAETVSPAPETVEGNLPQEETPTLAEGDAEAGREIFTDTSSPACGTCHTFEAAGTNAEVGPNLDESLADDDPESILESIVDPSAELTEGFSDLMPKDYGDKLDEQQLADLVAFLSQGR